MRPVPLLGALLALLALPAGAAQAGEAPPDPAAGASPLDRQAGDDPGPGEAPVALHVAGAPVSLRAYEDWLLVLHGEADARAYAELLGLREAAERLGRRPDAATLRRRATAEVEARLVEVHGGDRSAWAAELAREGRTARGRLVELEVVLERELLLAALADMRPPVREEEVQALWEARHGPGGRSPRVRLLRRRFVVPFEPGEDSASRRARTERLRAALHDEVAAFADEVRAGTPFGTLAERESDHPSRASGGRPVDGGWREGFPREALDTLTLQPVGTVSAPVFARGAYWLLQLEGIETVPLAEVRDAIEAELEARAARGYPGADAHLDTASVVVRPALLAPAGTAPEAVVFTVGDRPVRRAEYAAWLRRLHGEADAQRFALELRLRERTRGLELEPEALEAAVRRARATDVQLTAGGNVEAWRAALAARGLDEAAWRRAALRRLELEGLEDALARADRTVTEAAVRRAWQARYGPGGVRTRVRWIQLSVPPVPADTPEGARDAARAEAIGTTRARAAALRARLAEGADFAALARAHSDDAVTAARGGAPAEDFRPDRLPPEVRTALEGLDPGEVSPPILLAGEDAVVLVLLEAREQTPLETVRPALEQRLREAPADLVERALVRAALVEDLELAVHADVLFSAASDPAAAHER